MDFFDIAKLNLSGVCLGCLNANRKMYYSDRIREFFKRIVDIDIPEGVIVKVCWECMAYIDNVFRFKGTVERSYQTLTDYYMKKQAHNGPEDIGMCGNHRLKRWTYKLVDIPSQQELPIEYDIKLEPESVTDLDISLECEPLEESVSVEPVEGASVSDLGSGKVTLKEWEVRLVPLEGDAPLSSPLRVLEIKNTKTPPTMGKLYICDYCAKEFRSRYDLLRHMSSHTGEKRFSCELCAYRCNYSGNLKTHMGTHTGETPFSCALCTYKCSKRGNLKRHMRTHTGEKPFSCELCEYKCNDKGNLKTHLRTHTGEKPFSCEWCAYKCSDSGNLKKHENTHKRKPKTSTTTFIQM